ncbi:flagellar biosynthesis regulator FlaF [Epibacterium sp. SM1979]|uniref:Flagellar biosynthesis regulator FlaF n=1 Tax=Tritonibacter litoralis TaxID=2662264 RepID=A0A843YF57_9RHOB|nr:flagellar biosynthesis regulator FlaF [Tritonibacter litoralis]
MNAQLKAKNAYAAATKSASTPKSYEYKVIARVTRELLDAARKGKKGFPALASALETNRKLWRILENDLLSSGNQLPDDAKENLVYLAAFTRQHTPKVLRREAGVQPLLEINTAVLRGLRGGAT